MFVWTYSSHDAETNIFYLFFFLITNNNNTGLQGPSLNTSNDAAPSSSPLLWIEIFGGILQDHMRCLKYLMVEVELAPLSKDTESDIPKYGVGGYNP